MKVSEQHSPSLPSRSSVISYPNIEQGWSARDGVLTEDDASKHTRSWAQVDCHTYRAVSRLSFTHVPVPATSSSNQQLCCSILIFGSPWQQATALQFSLQVTHTSRIHHISTLLWHFITFK